MPRFYRVHIEDLAYYTNRPKGLFAAVGNLVDQKVMSPEECEKYWEHRRWFEENLPIPPFYEDPKPTLPITWFKNNRLGNAMFQRMEFYITMTLKYGRKPLVTVTSVEPGDIVYEDAFQIAVLDSLHEGIDFLTVQYDGSESLVGDLSWLRDT